MWMILLGPSPGVKHRHHPQLPSKKLTIQAKFGQGGNDRLNEDGIE